MVGHGPLCNGRVRERSANAVIVTLLNTTAECGPKGRTIRIAEDQPVDIAPEEHLTQRRVAAKIGLGFVGIAALALVPLTGSDPENWLLLANPVVPGFIMYGAWKIIPRRRDYLVQLKCRDSLHCFSDPSRVPGSLPQIRPTQFGR